MDKQYVRVWPGFKRLKYGSNGSRVVSSRGLRGWDAV